MSKGFKLVGALLLSSAMCFMGQGNVEASKYGADLEMGFVPANGDYQLLMDTVDAEEKRLSSLRTDPSEVGVWLRGQAGKSKIRDYKYNYTVSAAGYDWKTSNDKYNVFYGLTFSYAKNICDDGYIGDGKGINYGLYGSVLTKKHNAFVDVIAKFGKLEKEFNKGGTHGQGDYDKNSYVFSVKYGKRIQVNNGWYYEPSLGYTHGHLSAIDYKGYFDSDIHNDSINSKLGNLSVQVGKNVKGTDYYTRVTLLHDFDGVIKASNGYSTERDDMGGTWTKFIVGASRKVGKNNSFFMDVEKDFGSKVKKPYAVSLGYRHTF